MGAAAQYGKVSVIFDLLPDAYPDAGAAVGWIVSLVGFVGIIFGVMAGLVVARIRYRRALLSALWAGAAVSCLQAFLPPLPWMLFARVIEGASHLAIVVAETQRWFDEHGHVSVNQARGSVSQQTVPDPVAFERANYMKTLISYG